MNYYEFKFTGHPDPDIVVAWLQDWPFESFMESDGVYAYLPEKDYFAEMEEEVRLEMKARSIGCDVRFIPAQNWNEKWEMSFSPVFVDDFCCIRADFHQEQSGVRHDLIINPRMAFGTGHHDTTYMMIRSMRQLVFTGKKVLDFGTGTGLLAILAARLGAGSVLAVDNDPNSIDNARDNFQINGITGIDLTLGGLEHCPENQPYDIILANINLHVLTSHAENLSRLLARDGTLLVSGILVGQWEMLTQRFVPAGLRAVASVEQGGWSCGIFRSPR